MSQHPSHQRGIAHLGLIVLVIAVLAVIGGAGYVVMSKNKDTANPLTAASDKAAEKAIQAATKAQCDKLNDDDLCKFMTNMKMSKQYRITSTSSDGTKSVIEIDGDKTHMMMSGEYAYESISIDKTTYVKAGDTWYKQTTKTPETEVPSAAKPEIDDIVKDDTTPEKEDKTSYRKLGKEACGSLQCFKYEVVNPDTPDDKQFMWFDDKDYQLRRTSSVTPEGTTDQTYEYTGVKISVPSPVKELGPNQYIMPGSSEPMTMPSADMMAQ